MAKFKNITIKKKGGGTRKQRVKVLASGKYKFVKNKPKKGSSPRKTSKRRSSGKGRSMARRKRRRGKRKFTIPLAPTMAIAGQFARPAPSGRNLIGDLMDGSILNFVYDAREIFAGIDNTGAFRPDWLMSTYGPIVAAMLVHKFIGGPPLNLNRMLAQAGVPIVRI